MENAFIHKSWLLPPALAVLLLSGTVFAHSGGTNSDGCHTNSKTGDYHCHNGGTNGGGGSGGGSTYTPSPSYTSCEKPNEMVNGRCTDPVNACIAKYGHHSEYTNAGCGCEDGYQLNASKTGCDFANAASSSSKDDKARTLRRIEQSKNARTQQKTSTIVNSKASSSSAVSLGNQKAKVLSVTDGDTIKVELGTKTETIRIIGIDTPETVDPRKPVQCYGKEASAQMKKLLNGMTVTLEKNPAEERDKYDRLLRYVFIGSKDIGAGMIQDGYAFSYKQFPHPKLDAYNKLETNAKNGKKGLWGEACSSATTVIKSSSSASSKSSKQAVSSAASCNIKGNINSSKEHIYHIPGCASYNQTIIDVSAGERIFCSEEEALKAGWRKALNCR